MDTPRTQEHRPMILTGSTKLNRGGAKNKIIKKSLRLKNGATLIQSLKSRKSSTKDHCLSRWGRATNASNFTAEV